MTIYGRFKNKTKLEKKKIADPEFRIAFLHMMNKIFLMYNLLMLIFFFMNFNFNFVNY